MSLKTLEMFKAIVDDSMKDQSLETRRIKAANIIVEAHDQLSSEDFEVLLRYIIIEKLEK